VLRKFKYLVCIGVLVTSGSWWFGAHNESTNEAYTKNDYDDDCCKIYYDLGLSAMTRNDHARATQAFSTVLEHKPFHLDAFDRLGISHERANNKNAALTIYLQAMSFNPNFIETRVCRGIPINDISPEYEKLKEKTKWEGQPLEGKTIYIFAEKGLGDTIMFCRFIPQLKKQGATVLFKPQKWLSDLMKTSRLGAQIIEDSTNPSTLTFDYYASLLSVPHLINTDYSSIPLSAGYLKSDEPKISDFKTIISNPGTLNIGIVWQGDPSHINDKNRSIPLSHFAPLLRMDGIQCYSLQKGFGREQIAKLPPGCSIIDLDKYLKTFADTAAAIESLDLVISVDTAVAHLTGALGKKTWILLPHVTDWRWLGYSEQDTSVWYNSMKKFRHPESGSWKPVFNEILRELKLLM